MMYSAFTWRLMRASQGQVDGFYVGLTKVQLEMSLARVCMIYMFQKEAVPVRAESCRNVIQLKLKLKCSYIDCKISCLSLVKKKKINK